MLLAIGAYLFLGAVVGSTVWNANKLPRIYRASNSDKYYHVKLFAQSVICGLFWPVVIITFLPFLSSKGPH